MSTVPDPMSVHWPEMIDDQEMNTAFLKPLVTSPKIEIGEFTYYNDTDDPTLFETRNVLYTAGPEKLVIGKFCAIAMGAKFLLSSANHPMLGSTASPFCVFGGTWLEKTAEFLPRIRSRGNTLIGNDLWIGGEAVVMPGVTVGDGAIIAARAVVVSDVAPYTTVGGNPARLLKKRFPHEDIDRLLRLAWWNWPVDVITEHVRTIWTGTPAEIEQEAKDAGLLCTAGTQEVQRAMSLWCLRTPPRSRTMWVTVPVWPRTCFESYSVMLVASLIVGESAFACHWRRLTGGQRVPVDQSGCNLSGLRVFTPSPTRSG